MHEPQSLSAGELLFLRIFAVAALAIPLALVEFYPFSMLPMYCYRIERAATYRVLTPGGADLGPQRMDLQLVNLGTGASSRFHHRRARLLRRSANILGRPPLTDDALTQHLRVRLEKLSYPYLDVKIKEYGVLDAQRAGLLEERTFRVTRP